MASQEDFRALKALPTVARSLRKKSQRELLIEAAKVSRGEDESMKEHEQSHWKKD